MGGKNDRKNFLVWTGIIDRIYHREGVMNTNFEAFLVFLGIVIPLIVIATVIWWLF